MIPTTIHYCWFGGKPLPESAIKCIQSWKKFFPGYEIKQWDESNFDVNSIPYTAEAYKAGKYAFVSDYARFKIIHENGGVYFDTDVEVIKPFDDILANGPFMGRELPAKDGGDVNPGLGIGAEKGNPIYADMLDKYSRLHFSRPDGSLNLTTIVKYTTELLKNHGLECTDKTQVVNGITIYPVDYFNPLDDNTGKLKITPRTHSIHWYSKTWLEVNPLRLKISRIAHRVIGYRMAAFFKKLLRIK